MNWLRKALHNLMHPCETHGHTVHMDVKPCPGNVLGLFDRQVGNNYCLRCFKKFVIYGYVKEV